MKNSEMIIKAFSQAKDGDVDVSKTLERISVNFSLDDDEYIVNIVSKIAKPLFSSDDLKIKIAIDFQAKERSIYGTPHCLFSFDDEGEVGTISRKVISKQAADYLAERVESWLGAKFGAVTE